MKKLTSDYYRNLIFGVEDSLVSTLGVLFGITSVAGFSKRQIFLTGIITVVVEASSMGAGSFLSESTANELEGSKIKNPILDGIIMFFAYFFAGFIPLTPYIILPVAQARYVSVAITIVALYLLGFIPAKNHKSGIKMALVAGFAVLVGFMVAYFFRI
ncbi:VIT1/CCC1 transporter family protein [Patescibacteria group bacterium]